MLRVSYGRGIERGKKRNGEKKIIERKITNVVWRGVRKTQKSKNSLR